MGNEIRPELGKIYYQKRLKWYEKIWYFIIGKKNEYKELKGVIDVSVKE